MKLTDKPPRCGFCDAPLVLKGGIYAPCPCKGHQRPPKRKKGHSVESDAASIGMAMSMWFFRDHARRMLGKP